MPCLLKELQLRKDWVLTAEAREKALARRHQVRGKVLAEHTRELGVLPVGQVVQVQNQTGNHKNKWDLSGQVVEQLGFDSYLVRMDGSGRVSKRNRQFLKPIKTYGELLGGTPDYASVERQRECRQVAHRTLNEDKLSSSSVTSNPLTSPGSTLVDGPAPTEVPAQRDTVLETNNSTSSDISKEKAGPSEIEGSRSHGLGNKTTFGQPLAVEENTVIGEPIVRPTRLRKKPDFLVVGDINDPRFNRSAGR